MASLFNEKTHYTQLRQSMVSHETSYTNNELYGSKLLKSKTYTKLRKSMISFCKNVFI